MAEQCQIIVEARFFLGIATALFVISAIIVSLRLYTRLCLAKAYSWDDTSIIIAYIVSIASCSVTWKNFQLGLGRPLECFLPNDALRLFEFLVINESLCLISMTFSRLSVIIFVLRILNVNKHLRRFLYVWAVYMVIQQLTSALLPYAYCRPVDGAWNPISRLTGDCWSEGQIRAVVVFNGATSALSDLMLALLPAYFLIRLHLPLHKRVGLVVLMALGLIPAGCAIGRTILLDKSQRVIDNYIITILFIFGGLEMYTLLLCASVPALVPLYNKMRHPDRNRPYHQSTGWHTKGTSARLVESVSLSSSKRVLRDRDDSISQDAGSHFDRNVF